MPIVNILSLLISNTFFWDQNDGRASLASFFDKDDTFPSILESDGSSGEFRKNWARFIRLWWANPKDPMRSVLSPIPNAKIR
jgi:hypothetical protein